MELEGSFPHSQQTEGSLPYSQEPSIGPYPEPDKSNPHHPILSIQDPSQYYSPTYVLVFLVVSFLLVLPPVTYTRSLHSCYIPVVNFRMRSLTSTNCKTSRDSAVGIATGYGLDEWRVGIRVPVGSRMFIFPYLSDRFWGSLRLLSNWHQGILLGVKRPGIDANDLPPISDDVKKTWIYISTLPYAFLG
jgi:hypothetical protein